MNTSQTFSLFEPIPNELIPLGTLGYFRARNRGRVHDIVLDEFVKSGISQAELARRLGKSPEVICRWLGAPGNWGLETASDLLFAISGSEFAYSVVHPLREPPRNYTGPEWLLTFYDQTLPEPRATVQGPGTGSSISAVRFEPASPQ